MITPAKIRRLLHYDSRTGIFTWKRRAIVNKRSAVWNTRFAGKTAGYLAPDGYVRIMLEKIPRKAHRLAFLYMTGSCPKLIDHRNLVRSDNRWVNLRRCNHSQNHANSPLRADNTSGFKGVTWCKQLRKWKAAIHFYGKHTGAKYFEDINHAAAHYAALAKKHFGEFARP